MQKYSINNSSTLSYSTNDFEKTEPVLSQKFSKATLDDLTSQQKSKNELLFLESFKVKISKNETSARNSSMEKGYSYLKNGQIFLKIEKLSGKEYRGKFGKVSYCNSAFTLADKSIFRFFKLSKFTIKSLSRHGEDDEGELEGHFKTRVFREQTIANAFYYTSFQPLYFETKWSQKSKAYIFYPYLEGTNLTKFLAENLSILSLETRLSILKEISLQVEKLHLLGYVHFDLKPSNFIIYNLDITLIDFGISVKIGEKKNGFRGNNSFFNYESKFRDEYIASKESDIFSLGLIFYYLLSGKYPISKEIFEDKDKLIARLDEIKKEIKEFPIINKLQDFIILMLDSNLENRPSTKEIIEEIENNIFHPTTSKNTM